MKIPPIKWVEAPTSTRWGAGMMEALLPLGKDHTLRLYAEREALHLVPGVLAPSEAQAKPVAWCSMTPAGNIEYFDGKPMVMVGPVGNEHHTTPLCIHPLKEMK